MKLDLRKKQQYLGRIYVWLYPKKNELLYGINGTSEHFGMTGYKDMTKEDILKTIFKNIGGNNENL